MKNTHYAFKILLITAALSLTGQCTWRTVKPVSIKVWPPLSSAQPNEKEKPSVQIVIKDAKIVGDMFGKKQERKLNVIGSYNLEQYKKLMHQKFEESGVFSEVTSDEKVKTDLTIELFYAELASPTTGYDIAAWCTFLVLPYHSTSQNMISFRVLEGTKIRGESSSFERKHLLVELVLIIPGIVDLLVFEAKLKDAAPEKMIEAAFQNALEQNLFAPVKKEIVEVVNKGPLYFGRVFQVKGPSIVVQSSIASKLKSGDTLSFYENNKPVGKIRISSVMETRFTGGLAEGKKPSIGMLVGRGNL